MNAPKYKDKPYFRLYYSNLINDTLLTIELLQIKPESNYFLTVDCWNDLADPPYETVVFTSYQECIECINRILKCKNHAKTKKSSVLFKLRKCIANVLKSKEKNK